MEIVSAYVETRGVFKEAAASDAPKPVKDSPPADQQDQDLVRQTVDPPPRVQEDRSPPTGGVDADQTTTPSRSTRSATGPPESSVRPSGDAVKPLKLRKDQDATPPLENKSPEQLLAIRKVTAETLAQRSRGKRAIGNGRVHDKHTVRDQSPQLNDQRISLPGPAVGGIGHLAAPDTALAVRPFKRLDVRQFQCPEMRVEIRDCPLQSGGLIQRHDIGRCPRSDCCM